MCLFQDEFLLIRKTFMTISPETSVSVMVITASRRGKGKELRSPSRMMRLCHNGMRCHDKRKSTFKFVPLDGKLRDI